MTLLAVCQIELASTLAPFYNKRVELDVTMIIESCINGSKQAHDNALRPVMCMTFVVLGTEGEIAAWIKVRRGFEL